MFGVRFITAVLAVALLVTVLVLPEPVLLCAVFIINAAILFELYRALDITKKKPLFVLGMLPPLLIFFNIRAEIFIFIYAATLFITMISDHEKIKLSDISAVFFLSITVTFFIRNIVLVREIKNSGKYLVWLVFVAACMSDTFAYISGKLFGRHKLCEKLSPHKTVEGAVGAVVGDAVFCMVYGIIISKCFGLHVNIPALGVLGVLASAAAQAGDLSASAIKRECGIKDFGTVLPGHGGVLDRFDSILFTAPLVYFFVTLVPIIL